MFGYMSKKDRKIRDLEVALKQANKVIRIQNDAYLRATHINAEHQKLNGSLQTRITDLENNIELLINNLSKTKKKQMGLND